MIRTLSRTKRKDYENYVINRLYSLFDDLDIKPMTQKYVKRELEGKQGYALIDLYFPQFNIGIEIDEPHHILQEESDKLRTEDIVSKMGDGYIEKRILVFNKTIQDLNKAINESIEYIKNKKRQAIANNTFQKWEIISPKEYFLKRCKIIINDDVKFKTITEASNIIFGTEYIMQQ